ncbi:MAG: DUF58 domain-containing protein [Acidobacteria bacterium]|nr:MAG: DUF58 domain-containing protein [Acidobacteriota bacterium]
MNAHAPSKTRFLLPEVLARIRSLDLLARTVVEGFIAGLHRSPYLGFSTDFAEYRPYMPGDDLRALDWKLLGRTDRYYVKKFEGETNTHCTLIVDASTSMEYGSGPLTKREYACYLAASLAYLAYRQQDGVGLVTFADGLLEHIPARQRPGHLQAVLTALDRMTSKRETNVSQTLHTVAEVIKKRGIIVVISDLYGQPDELMTGLKHLRFRGHDVIVFHLLDEAELSFPFVDPVNMEDLETGERLHVVPEYLREEYLKLIQAHIHTLKTECGRAEIDYTLINTSQPLDWALFAYLSRRAKVH